MKFNQLFKYAIAANLSYAFWPQRQPLSAADLAAAALDAQLISPAWAARVFNDWGWKVPAAGIAPNDATGFAANLLVTPDEQILTIRGTEFSDSALDIVRALLPGQQLSEASILDFFGADLVDIGGLGLALGQATSLLNYVLRTAAPSGSSVPQYVLQRASAFELLPSPVPSGRVSLSFSEPGAAPLRHYFWFDAHPTSGLGLLGPDLPVTVTGHSLGGHLAVLALRVFPQVFAQGVAFNAPGFDRIGSAQLTDAFVARAALLGASAPAPDFHGLAGRLSNIVSESSSHDNDVAIIPSALTGFARLPAPILVRTELNSHGMDPLMESLAVLATLESLGPDLSPAALEAIFDAAATQPEASIEQLVSGLASVLDRRRAFTALGVSWIGYSDDAAVFSARNALQDALLPIQQGFATHPSARLVSLLETDPAMLAGLALESAAHRYALREFNPYAVVGDDTLYTQRISAPQLAAGQTSAAEWADRAQMFGYEMGRRRNDAPGPFVLGEQAVRFLDLRTGLEFQVQPVALGRPLARPTVRVAFGSELADGVAELAGSTGPDRLYGGGGADVLAGEPGDDHLEGGAGEDVLLGGEGRDTLAGGPGADVLCGSTLARGEDHASDLLLGGPGLDALYAAGGDVVRDTDGQLSVWANASWVPLSGAPLRALPGSPTVRVFETTGGPPLLLAWNVVTRELRVGGVSVLDFTPGDLDIRFPELPDLPPLPVVRGTPAGEVLAGSALADQLEALAGDDRLRGFEGDDRLDGGAGADVVLGDSGADRSCGAAGRDVLLGGEGHDQLDGGADDDALSGDEGNDLLLGGEGRDLLAGGPGADVLLGGAGDDVLIAGLSLLEPGADWQVVRGTPPLGQVLRDPRNLSLRQFGAVDLAQANWPHDPSGDWLYGEAGDDFLIGSAGDDDIDAGPGDDTALGGDGNDTLRGGPGADHLRGSGGADHLEGGEGDDFLVGYGDQADGAAPDGADQLSGGEGADQLQGGPGDDWLMGDAGADHLFGDAGDDQLWGGNEADTLSGDSGDDQLHGDAGRDELQGGAGADTALGGADDDVLDGGDGRDELYGEAGDDALLGGDDNDRLLGGAGDDRLTGGSGEDWLLGGPGADLLVGGTGNDTYWLARGDGHDVWSDTGGDDLVWLRDTPSLASWQMLESGTSLVLSQANGDALSLLNWRTSGLETLRFGSTGVLDGEHLLAPQWAGIAATVTTAGTHGSTGDDLLKLARVDGQVTGGAGNDRYVLTAQTQAQIDDPNGHNTLIFPDEMTLESVTLGLRGSAWAWSCEDLRVAAAPNTFARYVFGVGTVLTAEQMRERFLHDVPRAPQIAEQLGNRALVGGQAFSFGLAPEAFYDPNPAATLGYEARLAGGAALPAWLSFDPLTRLFSGTAPGDTVRSLAVAVRASDETALSATQVFGIDVLLPFRPNTQALFASEAINGTNGVWLQRPGAAYSQPATPVVAAVGDLNADGIADFLYNDTVRFGSRGSTGADFSRAAPNGDNGTRLLNAPDWVPGGRGQMRFQPLVADVNHDGIDDVVLGALGAETAGPRVLLGQRGHWASTLEYAGLSRPPAWPPAMAGAVSAPAAPPSLFYQGAPVTPDNWFALGDFNGDGKTDFGVTISPGDPRDVWLGVVFGSAALAATVNLDNPANAAALRLTLPPYEGFPRFDPNGALGASGWGPLSALGDINGDGLADVGLGSAPYLFTAGHAYAAVVLGQSGVGGALNLNALNGANGFLVSFPEPGSGYALGHTLRAAGDLNGDGYGDVLASDEARGAAFVIHGAAALVGSLQAGTAADDFIEARPDATVAAGPGDDVVHVHVRGPGGGNIYTGSGRNRVIIEAVSSVEISYPGPIVEVYGGREADIYEVFSRGRVQLSLHDSTGERNTLRLHGEHPLAQLRLRTGSVLLDLGPDAPQIHLEDVDFNDVLGGPRTVDTIEFDDGTRLDYGALIARGFDLVGSAAAEVLTGTSVTDRLLALAGDDRLVGGAGDDTLAGGAGDDRYVFATGSGQDLLIDTAGADTLLFTAAAGVAALHFAHVGLDLIITHGTNDTVRLSNWDAAPAARVENLVCGDAPPLNLLQLANRAPQASAALSTLAATVGTPFSLTPAAEWFSDPDPLDTLRWRLEAASGATPGWLSFNSVTHVLAGTPDTAQTLALRLVAQDEQGAQATRRLNITIAPAAPQRPSAGADWLVGTPGHDVLSGRAGNDHLDGLAGNDKLAGGAGADQLFGGAGADWLYGERGADTLDGGPGDDRLDGGAGDDWLLGAEGRDRLTGAAGNDRLSGGAGDDRYIFGRGFGRDVVANGDAAGFDEIVLEGVHRPRDLAWWREGDALTLAPRGTADRLTLADWYTQPTQRVDQFRLAGGATLHAAQVNQLVQALAGFDPLPGRALPLNHAALAPLESLLATFWQV
ncbi:MAG: hypothetical protein EXR83_09040 [Gammaproteobacteria bacterium]|nr:hypothetical protein [Gammaproteobacteria bacterium]